MPTSTTHLTTATDGTPVLERRWPAGDDGGEAAALADLLRRAVHPGVVELVEVVEDPPAVRTRYVGSTTATDLSDADDVDALVRVVAEVAATLADLHARGIVHGRLAARHLLLDAWGSPVVVGWRVWPIPGPTPADDVKALGDLVSQLAGPGFDRQRDELRAIASRARAADSSARPTMAVVADALAALVPADDDVADRVLRPRTAPGRRHPRRRLALAAAGGLVAMAAAAAGVLVLDEEATPRATIQVRRAPVDTPAPRVATSSTSPTSTTASSTTTITTTTTTDTEPATEPARLWPPGCPPIDADLGHDVDGDGCPDQVEVEGQTVRVAGSTWTLGQTGDVVRTGDWDCDGSATPLVLRPATGELWVVERWPAAGTHLAATAVGAVADAREATATDVDGDACTDLVVTRADGSTVQVELSGA